MQKTRRAVQLRFAPLQVAVLAGLQLPQAALLEQGAGAPHGHL